MDRLDDARLVLAGHQSAEGPKVVVRIREGREGARPRHRLADRATLLQGVAGLIDPGYLGRDLLDKLERAGVNAVDYCFVGSIVQGPMKVVKNVRASGDWLELVAHVVQHGLAVGLIQLGRTRQVCLELPVVLELHYKT